MLYPFLRPFLFAVDSEHAHQLALNALRLLQNVPFALTAPTTPRLVQDLWGLQFSNPIGLAAGYDKNAAAPLAWPALGFGFAELGTITAKAQPGNPKPRIFRLPADEALINRLGFNNDGATTVAQRLAELLPPTRQHPIPLGLNLGKSKITPLDEATDDYLASLDLLFPFADYLVVNVSSPNTPELRKLQEPERLGRLLETLQTRNAQLTVSPRPPKPLLVKIAPDLSDAAVVEVARVAQSVGVAGLIATNTTIARPPLRTSINEEGGLSGKPLAARAINVLRVLYRAVEGKMPLIGVGGIFSAEDAYARIRAGASLVQIYTALIYRGPTAPRRIVHGLNTLLARDGVTNIRQVIGKDV
ncbi:MAG: quinone-dependent dihydroorotate dehydrogenase [Candidatus Binatia bacterium]